MAIKYEDGKAGQYAKSQAFGKYYRRMCIVLAITMAISLVLGFVLGATSFSKYAWARRPSAGFVWLGTLAEAAATIVALIVMRKAEIPLDKLARERIYWMRGAQAESLVAWLLHDLPDTWHVFHNLQLRNGSDIDHVLVGPGGLYCISTKANRGLYSVRDGVYLLNGEPTDHLHDAVRQAMQLKERLAALMGTVPWIQPVLAVPFAFVQFPSFQEKAWVLNDHNLDETFEQQPGKLKAEAVRQCVGALTMLASHAKDVYRDPAPPAPLAPAS